MFIVGCEVAALASDVLDHTVSLTVVQCPFLTWPHPRALFTVGAATIAFVDVVGPRALF
jgi:hypothetical protein